jgi:alpha-L-fucosidase
MRDLAAECAKQGITFAFYHSILDWHHPDFTPAPDWDKKAREGYTPDPDKYIEFLKTQVREICSNYGPIAILWYDGGHRGVFDGKRTRMREINAMARELQPQILINNRSVMSEDFITPEQYIPPTGLFGPDGEPLLWENCITLTAGSGSYPPSAWWGYDKNEKKFKDAEYVIRMLADIVSKGGNLLLNVGPSPEGEIGPNETRTLEATGRWLDKYGESIYGTTASPFRYLPFYGRATAKGNTLYAIVFAWPKDRQLALPGVKNEIRGVRLLGEPEAKLKAERRVSDIVVSLPEKAPDAIASVVAVDLDGTPVVEPQKIQAGPDGTIALPILYADLRGKHGQHMRIETPDGEAQIGRWDNSNDYLTWEFSLPQAGKYDVSLVCAADQAADGGTFQVIAGSIESATTAPAGKDVMNTVSPEVVNQLAAKGSVCEGKVAATGSTNTFAAQKVGSITLPAGKCVLVIRPTKINKDATLMNLRQVTLTPAQ